MLAKFIVHGRDRDDAIRRLASALEDAPLLGPVNNGRFLRDLIRHPAFRAAWLHTGLLDEWALSAEPLLQRPQPADADWLVAAALLALPENPGADRHAERRIGQHPEPGAHGLRAAPATGRRAARRWRVRLPDAHTVLLEADGVEHRVQWLGRDADGRQRLAVDGVQRGCIAQRAGRRLQLASDAAVHLFEEPSAVPVDAVVDDPLRACAPVAGLLAQLRVACGDRVVEGQPMASVEAMKMEMWLCAACDGRVKAVHAAPQQAVAAGALLIELEPLEAR
jgi:geranyl-CoA carboxylase alpha subunit